MCSPPYWVGKIILLVILHEKKWQLGLTLNLFNLSIFICTQLIERQQFYRLLQLGLCPCHLYTLQV